MSQSKDLALTQSAQPVQGELVEPGTYERVQAERPGLFPGVPGAIYYDYFMSPEGTPPVFRRRITEEERVSVVVEFV